MLQVKASLETLVAIKQQDSDRRNHLLRAGAPFELLSYRFWSSTQQAIDQNFELLSNHYMSYDLTHVAIMSFQP
jgi:hypothetical protein